MSALAPQLLRDALLVELFTAGQVGLAPVTLQTAVIRIAARTSEPAVTGLAKFTQLPHSSVCKILKITLLYSYCK